ncbi:MAG: type IV toxin-antitoxin system AbiEi family antitoxin domain-containing protein [Thermoguttaceae bacterium]|nr:type IV toxin-antitoxin system AbiEi family antitoxin domain-containing protein [Thermoguttaceae bacterium]
MTRFDALDNLVEKGNGYLCTSQVVDAGISKPTLAQYVRQRKMERVAQGVYLAEDAWPDDLYLLCLSNSRMVFSHETALMFHGLMEREPKITSVTVKAGYNATHLRRRGIRVYQIKPDLYDLGIAEVRTSFGNTVRAYDKDRTICDILRCKETMDVQVFRYAMREYMANPHKNLNHLMEYAKRFRVDADMRTYTEVML